MKTLLLILLFNITSYSQVNNLTISKSINSFSTSTHLKNNLTLTQPNFKLNALENRKHFFSIYDRNTKLNNIYYLTKNSMELINMVHYNGNQFMQVDSFNPLGAPDLASGLLLGTINYILPEIINIGPTGGINLWRKN